MPPIRPEKGAPVGEANQCPCDLEIGQHPRAQDFVHCQASNNKENFEKRLKNDELKNQYALNNNIPLVRIPYWDRGHITIEMLLGDEYLVKEVKFDDTIKQ